MICWSERTTAAPRDHLRRWLLGVGEKPVAVPYQFLKIACHKLIFRVPREMR